MSLVDMQASESMRSNVTAVAARSAASRSAGVDDGVGGRGRRASSRAPARACPRPWPCRRPTSRRPASTATLCTRVGRLDRDGGVLVAVRRRERRGRGVDPGADPVHRQQLADEPGRADDDVAGRDSEDVGDLLGRAVRVVEALRGRCRRWRPPELRTTASTRPSATTWRDQTTGAASTRLLVKTAAAWWSGPSLTTSARSGCAARLEPGGDAGGAEAGGLTVAAHGATPAIGQAGGLVETEGEVGALHGAAGGALGEVVDGGDDDDPADRSSTRTCRCAALLPRTSTVRGHWPSGSRWTNGSSAYAVSQASRTLAGVGAGPEPGRAGGEDAAGHRREGRGERDRDTGSPAAAREVLLDLGGVPVPAADAVGRHRAHHLRAEQVRLERPCPAPEVPRGGDDDDVVGLEQPGGEAGREREGDGGRVAAGDGDPRAHPSGARAAAAAGQGSSGRP